MKTTRYYYDMLDHYCQLMDIDNFGVLDTVYPGVPGA